MGSSSSISISRRLYTITIVTIYCIISYSSISSLSPLSSLSSLLSKNGSNIYCHALLPTIPSYSQKIRLQFLEEKQSPTKQHFLRKQLEEQQYQQYQSFHKIRSSLYAIGNNDNRRRGNGNNKNQQRQSLRSYSSSSFSSSSSSPSSSTSTMTRTKRNKKTSSKNIDPLLQKLISKR